MCAKIYKEQRKKCFKNYRNQKLRPLPDPHEYIAHSKHANAELS